MLQKLLDALKEWCLDNGMSINPNRTKIMHFRYPRKKICQFQFTCGEVTIQYTDCYKYLGVDFSEHLSWAKSVENTAISANKAASYLIAKARSSGAFVYTVYNHLYNTLVLPIIEYSSFIWGLKSFNHISKIQNNPMRSFLGVGRNAPIAALLGEMGWLPIAVLAKISCIRFWLRLSKMSQTRLNYAFFAESCTLAENGKKNWAFYIKAYLHDLSINLCFSPSIHDEHFIQYYKDAATNLYKLEWLRQIQMVREASETGGRLNIYRRIKADFPTTERYVANIRSVGMRRVLAGLWVGCLPLAVETGRYTGVPLCQRSCRLCDRREVEDQTHF